MNAIVQVAYEAARRVRERAYAPYSNFKVGAALMAAGSDRIFEGCNVENLSFGATICAERAALVKMVSEIGAPRISLIVVVTDTTPATLPCGLCLQVLSEFCGADCPVHLANMDGIERMVRFDSLLPYPFIEWDR